MSIPSGALTIRSNFPPWGNRVLWLSRHGRTGRAVSRWMWNGMNRLKPCSSFMACGIVSTHSRTLHLCFITRELKWHLLFISTKLRPLTKGYPPRKCQSRKFGYHLSCMNQREYLLRTLWMTGGIRYHTDSTTLVLPINDTLLYGLDGLTTLTSPAISQFQLALSQQIVLVRNSVFCMLA